MTATPGILLLEGMPGEAFNAFMGLLVGPVHQLADEVSVQLRPVSLCWQRLLVVPRSLGDHQLGTVYSYVLLTNIQIKYWIILKKTFGVKIVNCSPALTPINIKSFNLKSLSGISFENASQPLLPLIHKKSIYKISGRDILITETCSWSSCLELLRFINKLNSTFFKQECKDFELIAAN